MGNSNFKQDKIKNRQIEDKVKNYTDPEGITTKQLEFGLWYVEHKDKLRFALYGLLIIISVISWSYTLYGFGYYLASGMNEDEILAKELVQTSSIGHDYVEQISAKELGFSPVGIIASGQQKYDLYVAIKNDNQKWWAEFDYYFLVAGKETEKKSGYILPAEEKYLMSLAQDFTNQPADGRLIMENIRWHRITPHQISDWGYYYNSHLNIDVKDIKFTPTNASDLLLNELIFKVTNNTAYNYWEAGFNILLTSGSQLAGINHYSLNNFMSGQTREVQINWLGNIGSVDRVQIIPEINIMASGIYIPHEGSVGQEK